MQQPTHTAIPRGVQWWGSSIVSDQMADEGATAEVAVGMLAWRQLCNSRASSLYNACFFRRWWENILAMHNIDAAALLVSQSSSTEHQQHSFLLIF